MSLRSSKCRPSTALFVALMASSVLTVPWRTAAAQSVASCIESHESAQRARIHGHLRAARDHLDACNRPACPAPIQRDCAEWQSEVVATLPTVVLSVLEPDGSSPRGHEILLDGQPLPQGSLGKVLEVDPGEHVLSVQPLAGKEQSRHFTAVAGAKNTLIELRLTVATEPVPDPDPSAPLPVSFWIAASVTGVGLTAFAVLGSVGLADEHHLRDRCAGTCLETDVDRVRRTYLAGDILGLVGVAAGITTAAIAIVHVQAHSEPSTGQPSALEITFGPGWGSASWSF